MGDTKDKYRSSFGQTLIGGIPRSISYALAGAISNAPAGGNAGSSASQRV
jgi:hypothetical protein